MKLLDDESMRYFRTEQDLEEAYRQAACRSFQLGGDKRRDGLAIAQQKPFLMVLGGPGIGKSTFLRKLGSEALNPQGQIYRGYIPVLIELKELKDPEIDLTQIIAKEFETCGFPGAEAFTTKALEQGKLLVLLDGLDEVPKQNFINVAECIEDFADRYDGNRFVASCRIAAYSSSFRRFTDVTIAEFDNEQIEQFIRNWFDSELDQREKTAEKYWQLLCQPEHQATKELAQTPLLLTFLCLIYDREQTLPQTRSTLYGDALNILLKEWAAQKRLERDPIYEGFHPDLEKELLAQIAYDSFQQDRLFFSKEEVTERIAAFLADTLEAPSHLDGAAVLKAIEVQQGILVERATNTYSFSHLTIQEYLATQYIVGNGLVEATVQSHALENRWREVFLLMAGLLRGQVQTLWLALEQATFCQFKASQKLKDLVQWADVIANTPYQSLETRAAALYTARALPLTLSFARALSFELDAGCGLDSNVVLVRSSSLSFDPAIVLAIVLVRSSDPALAHISNLFLAFRPTRDIARAIAHALHPTRDLIEAQVFSAENLSEFPETLVQLQATCPDEDAYPQDWDQWANELEAAWLDAFDLTKEAVTLSAGEAEALASYLYITELIVRCKESAVRVSKKEWQALESRLLTLKGYEAWKEDGGE